MITGKKKQKTNQVNEDSQKLMRLKGCLKEMREIREIIHSVETNSPESEADPFAVLRQLFDKAVICDTGMPYRGEK